MCLTLVSIHFFLGVNRQTSICAAYDGHSVSSENSRPPSSIQKKTRGSSSMATAWTGEDGEGTLAMGEGGTRQLVNGQLSQLNEKATG